MSLALDPEPPAGGPDATRVQLRCPDGKKLLRRFPLEAPVGALYRYVHEALLVLNNNPGGAADAAAAAGGGGSQAQQPPQPQQRSFDLMTPFPAASLWQPMLEGTTVRAAGLANSVLSVVWT